MELNEEIRGKRMRKWRKERANNALLEILMRKNKTIARKQKREDLKLHGISVPHHTKKKVK